jgi:DNA-binding XRE family transcriptional regulator
MDGTDFKDFKAQLLEEPDIRRKYEALKPRYEMIQAIIARRNELSLSQRQLARMVGMQQPAICRLERGDQNITVGTLCRVADALDMDLSVHARSREAYKVLS